MSRMVSSPPVFTLDPQSKFWLLNGHADFAKIPAGVIGQYPDGVPIRLPAGDKKYGAIHILQGHGHWVRRHQPNGCVATLLHRKLSQPGRIFTAESDNKMTIAMRMAPDAFLVLKLMADFMSVTTLYLRQRTLEGTEVGRYLGHEWAVAPFRPRPL